MATMNMDAGTMIHAMGCTAKSVPSGSSPCTIPDMVTAAERDAATVVFWGAEKWRVLDRNVSMLVVAGDAVDGYDTHTLRRCS